MDDEAAKAQARHDGECRNNQGDGRWRSDHRRGDGDSHPRARSWVVGALIRVLSLGVVAGAETRGDKVVFSVKGVSSSYFPVVIKISDKALEA